MRVEFSILGLPPIKRGEKSMWATQGSRIRDLRLAAHSAFAGKPPLTKNVRLRLDLYVASNLAGDLDNFITGVCDGLMAADSKVWAFIDEKILPNRSDIDPRKPVGIVSDSEVVEIHGCKIVGDDGQERYQVILEGE